MRILVTEEAGDRTYPARFRDWMDAVVQARQCVNRGRHSDPVNVPFRNRTLTIGVPAGRLLEAHAAYSQSWHTPAVVDLRPKD